MNESDDLDQFVHPDASKLKVLHIGNIANNGYNIANLFNQAGVKSDLIVGPYYHFAGCPEWEDAEFKGDIGDQFYPSWHKVKITNGFKRPLWVAQGPWELCIKYHLHRNQGHRMRAKFYWTYLKLSQRFAANEAAVKMVNAVGNPNKASQKIKWIVAGSRFNVRIFFINLLTTIKSVANQLLWKLRHVVFWKLKNVIYRIFWQIKNVWLWRLKNTVYLTKYWFVRITIRSAATLLRSNSFTMPLYISLKRWYLMRRETINELKSTDTLAMPEEALVVSEDVQTISHLKKAVPQVNFDDINSLKNRKASTDTQILDAPSKDKYAVIRDEELIPYKGLAQQMKPLFDYYDVVVAYSTDGIWPLLADKKYIAYEHGTIRTLPFEDSLGGRVCKLVYQQANSVVVSNFDNNVAAEKLGLQKYTCIPHYINEMRVPEQEGLALRKKWMTEHDCDFIVYNPSRQHWSDKADVGWEKGNDVMIRGAAQFIKTVHATTLLVFTDWGESVDKTKELIKELGIERNVLWVAPVPHKQMILNILASHVVSDQFLLGTFGGIPAKAFLHRRPVLSSFTKAIHQWCFDEMPPFLESGSEDDICRSLTKCATDSEFYEQTGAASYDWYQNNHSNRVLLSKMTGMLVDI